MPLAEKTEAFAIIRVGAPRILKILSSGRLLRFGEIYGALKPESAATLTRRLREMAVLGLVKREVKDEVGHSIVVTYKITDEGRRALEHFEALEAIVKEGRARASQTR